MKEVRRHDFIKYGKKVNNEPKRFVWVSDIFKIVKHSTGLTSPVGEWEFYADLSPALREAICSKKSERFTVPITSYVSSRYFSCS